MGATTQHRLAQALMPAVAIRWNDAPDTADDDNHDEGRNRRKPPLDFRIKWGVSDHIRLDDPKANKDDQCKDKRCNHVFPL